MGRHEQTAHPFAGRRFSGQHQDARVPAEAVYRADDDLHARRVTLDEAQEMGLEVGWRRGFLDESLEGLRVECGWTGQGVAEMGVVRHGDWR